MGWWAGEPLCQGDQGADIIGEALEELDKVWQAAWGRRITKEEVLATLDFCWPAHEDNDGDDSGEFELYLPSRN